ncbi:phage terminase large subunit [Brevundimonas diminuta]|uniref:phage terminase large subunit n=1 Tax=Brevundimonas diminuta TaxID=293 RepID=UPI0037CCBD3E
MTSEVDHKNDLNTPQLPASIQLSIEYLPIAALIAEGRKLKLHKASDITALARAIEVFGFLVPVLIDQDSKIISGNGRLEAARKLGLQDVPCIRIRHLSSDQLRVFRIAENQLGQLAGWDTEALGLELQDLSNIDLGFSLEVTGLSSARIDSLILEGDGGGENADTLPDRPNEPVSRLNKVVHSWDVASSSDPKADYSVGTIWGHDGTSWLLLDVIRQRLLYPDLLARVRLERKLWKADAILVEKSSVGPALLEDLARDMRGISDPQFHARACIRLGINATLPKAERYFASVERLYSGFAKLPRSATWLDDLHREMQTFPAARYDDQVDSLSQFLNWAPSRQGRNILKDSDTRRDGPRPR